MDVYADQCYADTLDLDWLNHGSILNFLLGLSKIDIGEVCPSLEHFLSFMNEAHISSLGILIRKYSTPQTKSIPFTPQNLDWEVLKRLIESFGSSRS